MPNYPQEQIPNQDANQGYYYPQQGYDSNQNYNTPPTQTYFTTGLEPQPVQQEKPRKTTKTLENFMSFLKTNWWIVLILLVILVIFAIGLSLLFSGSNGQNKTNGSEIKNVTATITAPRELPQGTPGQWELLVENKEKVAINNIIVDFDFDTDFEFTREISPRPEKADGTEFKIAALDPTGGRSSSVKITFEGVLTGKPDIETKMSGNVTYQPLLSTGQLGKVLSIPITQSITKITSPEIDLSLVPTETSVQNTGEAEFTVRVKNRVDREFRDLRVRMIYPAGNNSFTYTSSEYSFGNTAAPKTSPDDGDNTWFTSRLAGGAEHVLKVRGNVVGTNGIKLTFGVEVGIKTKDNSYRVIRENYKDINIVAQPLVLSAKIDGKDGKKIFSPGETLTVVVQYSNQSQQVYNNVELTSFIDDGADALDLGTIDFQGGERGDITGNQIYWRPARIPQLATVKPGQSGLLKYTVKVKPLESFINPNLDQTKYTLRPGIQASAQNLQLIKFAGDLYKGKGNLEFIQDDPVFKETNPVTNRDVYTVTWRMRTWQNQVTNVKVSTISPLPIGSWLNQITPAASASSIKYNEKTGEIVWDVGKLESYTGRSNPEISISFNVEVPTNTNDTIVKAPQVTGLDVFTAEQYEFKGKQTDARR